MSIWCIVSVRPNFIKFAPLVKELEQRGHAPKIVNTGQHYDDRMSSIFFEELEIRNPDANLGVGSGSHAVQTAEIMLALDEEFRNDRPDLVVVLGADNSSLAGSLTAAKLGIPVAHIDAGLCSESLHTAQIINRKLIDSLSTIHFVHSEDARKVLLNEQIDEESIHFVGNLLIDVLKGYDASIRSCPVLEEMEFKPGGYGLVTMHLPHNVDKEEVLIELLETFRELAGRLPLIYPVHPRTRNMLHRFGLWEELESIEGMTPTEPLGYFSFQALLSQAKMVLTDSGGVQEEATVWGVPCLTLAGETSSRVTVRQGTNSLVGNQKVAILHHAEKVLRGEGKKANIPELWDGHAAPRIVDVLLNVLEERD